VFCNEVLLFMMPGEGTFQLSLLDLSLEFWIKLLVCSVCCVCVQCSCEYKFSVPRISFLKKLNESVVAHPDTELWHSSY
jgi:hypothetical protein